MKRVGGAVLAIFKQVGRAFCALELARVAQSEYIDQRGQWQRR